MHPPHRSSSPLSAPSSILYVSVLLVLILLNSCIVSSSPLVGPASIRPLICLDKIRGESGICMFSMDCQKMKGRSLGVCGDRMYFGSCCVVPSDLIDDDEELNALDKIAKSELKRSSSSPAQKTAQYQQQQQATYLLDMEEDS